LDYSSCPGAPQVLVLEFNDLVAAATAAVRRPVTWQLLRKVARTITAYDPERTFWVLIKVAMKKVTRTVLISAVIGAPILLVIGQTAGSGLSWTDMDWNNDGHTSIGEVADFLLDMDVRSIAADGKPCREVYLLKDGMPVRQLCP